MSTRPRSTVETTDEGTAEPDEPDPDGGVVEPELPPDGALNDPWPPELEAMLVELAAGRRRA
jgi:hypothetical protein